MTKNFIPLLIGLTFLLSACTPKADRFVGTWSLAYMGNKEADMTLVISKDGDGVIVKEVLSTNGFVLRTDYGTIDGNHINLPPTSLYPMLGLSDDGKVMSVLNNMMGRPDFHKVE